MKSKIKLISLVRWDLTDLDWKPQISTQYTLYRDLVFSYIFPLTQNTASSEFFEMSYKMRRGKKRELQPGGINLTEALSGLKFKAGGDVWFSKNRRETRNKTWPIWVPCSSACLSEQAMVLKVLREESISRRRCRTRRWSLSVEWTSVEAWEQRSNFRRWWLVDGGRGIRCQEMWPWGGAET